MDTAEDNISEVCSEDFSEQVQLGFVDDMTEEEKAGGMLFEQPLWGEWDGGKIGGRPVWLDPEHVPPVNGSSTLDATPSTSGAEAAVTATQRPVSSLLCTHCNDPLAFVLQIYCPLDPGDMPGAEAEPETATGGAEQREGFRAFHRCLYVFMCRRAACLRQAISAQERRAGSDDSFIPPVPASGAVQCLRCQLPKQNSFYPAQSKNCDDYDSGVFRSRRESKLPSLCSLCGLKAPYTCAKCKSAHYCCKAHQKLHWATGGHKKACGVANNASSAAADAKTQGLTQFPEHALDIVCERDEYEDMKLERVEEERRFTAMLPANTSTSATEDDDDAASEAVAAAAIRENDKQQATTKNNASEVTNGSSGGDAGGLTEEEKLIESILRKEDGQKSVDGAVSQRDLQLLSGRVDVKAYLRSKAGGVGAAASASASGVEVEVDESALEDRVYDRFTTHMRRSNPRQVLRYHRWPGNSLSTPGQGAGEIEAAMSRAAIGANPAGRAAPIGPLRVCAKSYRYKSSECATTTDVLIHGHSDAPRPVPPCVHCGGPRRFEFQILPTLLHFLHRGRSVNTLTKAGEGGGAGSKSATGGDADEEADFGSLDVYTCINSCAGSSPGNAYKEEFIALQPPPSSSYYTTGRVAVSGAAVS